MATSSKEAPIAIVNPSLAIMKPDAVSPGLAILQFNADAAKPASKSIVGVSFPESIHPLDPLTPAEIAVAVVTVSASRGTLEVLDGMRFVEIVLNKTYKHIIALADVNSFLPLQPSILQSGKGTVGKGGLLFPSDCHLDRPNLLVTTNSRMSSVWIIELTAVYAAVHASLH